MKDSVQVSLRELFKVKAHLGHVKSRWNPKMSPYIYGVLNGIHIIDLFQTQALLTKALKKIQDVSKAGGKILFVGSRPHASVLLSELANKTGHYFLIHRWLGGTMTNWKTISVSIEKLKKMERDMADEEKMSCYTKKEKSMMQRQLDKLESFLGGIKEMNSLPDLIFIADTNADHLALAEAKHLKISTMAILDTNSDPEGVDYPIPANDDSIYPIQYLCSLFENAMKKEVFDKGAPTDIAGTETTIESIKKLRQISGAGVMACKKALDAFNGDLEKARGYLRKEGFAYQSDKKVDEGAIALLHNNDKAILLEVKTETDFAVKSEKFLTFVNFVAKYCFDNELQEVSEEVEDIKRELGVLVSAIGEKVLLGRYKLLKSPHIYYYLHSRFQDNIGRIGALVTFNLKIEEEIGKKIAMQVATMAPDFISRKDINVELKEEDSAAFVSRAVLIEQNFIFDTKITVGEFLKGINQSLEVTSFERFRVGE